MDLLGAFRFHEAYDAWLLALGIAFLAAAALPRLVSERPVSMPLVLFALGFLAIGLPLGLDAPDPLRYTHVAERVTEIGVIVALMGAGLKIDRVPSLHGWSVTWRLLGVTMVLTIGLTALIGWQVAAFVPATALLLGAVIAPTDPVLATEVQVGPPGRGSQEAELEETHPRAAGKEDEVRFALTSEAGLNDGLAFPFTNLAIAVAVSGLAPGGWVADWLLVDVLYKLGVGLVGGLVMGYLLGRLITLIPARTSIARAMTGIAAISATLVIYGVTELASGYGFIAVFVGAIMIRHAHGEQEYHVPMFIATEQTERLLTAGILLAFGGAVAGGLLAPLTWPLVLSALLIFLVVRPVTGMIGLLGSRRVPPRERLFISFFGIRGIGSLYYLAYALNHADFPQVEEVWAVISLVIVLSIVVHGVLAAPFTTRLDALRQGKGGPFDRRS